jgi:hypothetical protein
MNDLIVIKSLELLELHVAAGRSLKDCGGILGTIAERICHIEYGASYSGKVNQRGFDLLMPDGSRLQVKATAQDGTAKGGKVGRADITVSPRFFETDHVAVIAFYIDGEKVKYHIAFFGTIAEATLLVGGTKYPRMFKVMVGR